MIKDFERTLKILEESKRTKNLGDLALAIKGFDGFVEFYSKCRDNKEEIEGYIKKFEKSMEKILGEGWKYNPKSNLINSKSLNYVIG